MLRRLSEKAAWYGRRLSSMSAPEILYRLGEKAKRTASRYRSSALPDAVRPGPGGLPELPGLLDGVTELSGRAGFASRLRASLAPFLDGGAELLGVTWPQADGRKRWHLDPVTRRSWPADAFCFAIPYRHAGDMGDVKYVWELNRLPHLQAMALLARLEDDRELAQRCVAEIESWIDANPPFRGVNWASGIELALRTVSFLVAATLLGPETIPPETALRLRATLAAHGYWLMRYPSRFSSANNHLVAEAAGLFLLGTLAPDLPGAGRWADYGRRTLIREAELQICVDGVGLEQSPSYTAFTLEWLLLAGVVGARTGRPFPPGYWDRIARAGHVLRWLCDDNGNVPRIGDDDEGHVLHGGAEENYAAGILGSIAAATGNPDLAPPRCPPHLREAMFGRAPPNRTGPSGVLSLNDGGYTIVRFATGRGPCLFAMDHGPLGYLSIAAHGHADTLAVWLHVGGQPVLVDAGTYLYHSGGSDRDHFRGTSAHNTLTIEGADSSRTAGAFNWTEKARARMLACDADPLKWFVLAEHDGYVKRFGLRHRRRASAAGSGAIEIEDTLVGTGPPRRVEIGFLIHPALTVYGANTAWRIAEHGRTILTIEHHGPLQGEIQRGLASPARGWYSPAFGRKVPAPRLAFTGELVPEQRCVCRLAIT